MRGPVPPAPPERARELSSVRSAGSRRAGTLDHVHARVVERCAPGRIRSTCPRSPSRLNAGDRRSGALPPRAGRVYAPGRARSCLLTARGTAIMHSRQRDRGRPERIGSCRWSGSRSEDLDSCNVYPVGNTCVRVGADRDRRRARCAPRLATRQRGGEDRWGRAARGLGALNDSEHEAIRGRGGVVSYFGPVLRRCTLDGPLEREADGQQRASAPEVPGKDKGRSRVAAADVAQRPMPLDL
jgi:hypothetical protein